MICVSIARGRHRHMIAEHRHLVQQGAQLVELRLDYINGEVNLKRLLADRPSPVVITCRRERDGGKFTGTEEQRQMLLRTAIAEGVEYVDLEDDIAGDDSALRQDQADHQPARLPQDARRPGRDPRPAGGARRRHRQDWPRWPTIRTTTCGCCNWCAQLKVPTVGICMGDIGTPSRILAGRFGAPFTFATFHHERTLAPGQLSFQQMTEIYHYDRIDAETEVYGVIGDPIGHSLSPLVHNAAFRQPGHQRGLRAVSRAARAPVAVSRRRAGAWASRA